MVTLIETVVAAIGVSVVTAILRYGKVIAEAGLGVRLMTASSSFFLLAAAFKLLSSVFELHDRTTAIQIERAGIYLGFGVGSVIALVGCILIVVACFLPSE